MNDEYETLYQAQGSAATITSPRSEAEGGFTGSRKGSHSGGLQAGRNATSLDLAGVGEARLECTVGHPLKENDGSKDAYISYLVTTHVCTFLDLLRTWLMITCRLISPLSLNLPPTSADASPI